MEKQINLSKGKPGCAQGSAGRYRNIRRPVLLCSEDPSLVSIEELRASRVRDHSRDMSPHFVTSAVRDHSEYTSTPHQMPKIKQVIATYPAMMKFHRWHRHRQQAEDDRPEPDVPTPTFGPYTDCTTMTSPSKVSLLKDATSNCVSAGVATDTRMKSNIMTFCDQFTMTLRLQDTAVDTKESTKSILKKCENTKCEAKKSETKNQTDFQQAIKDADKPIYRPESAKKDCMKCKIKMALKCLSPMCRVCNNSDEDESRKRVMFDGHAHCKTFEDDGDLELDSYIPDSYSFDLCNCRTTAASQASETYIPHSHRHRSRYHDHCFDEMPRGCRDLSPGCGSRKLCSNFERLHAKFAHCNHGMKSSCDTKCVSLQAKPLSSAPSTCEFGERYSRSLSRARPCPYQTYGRPASPYYYSLHTHTPIRKYGGPNYDACYRTRY